MASNQFVELTGLDWTPSLAKALRVLGTYDVVGLMDRFEESLLAISERFGFLPPEVMPGLNKALDGIDPDRALSEQDIAHIEGYLTDDLELYRVAAERLHASTADRSSMLAGLFSKGIIRQVDGPLELDLGRPFPGSGWYAPERQGDHLVRWSGPASRAMLYLPIDRDRRRSLQIAVVKPAFVPGVHIYLDADRAEPRVTQDGQVLRLEVDVPEQSAPERPWTTITVDTMHASTPGERGDSDLRTLGVLLLSVSVT
jgi:hypothetical protein